MNDISSKFPIYEIKKFKEIGFEAGITLKGEWGSQENIYRHLRSLMPNKEIIIPVQVHGAEIFYLNSDGIGESCQVDGVITKCKDLCLSVTTADCIPLILAEPKSGLFGAIHVGWRSFISGIMENAFQTFSNMGIDIGNVNLEIGPGIGPCCFEVGKEVSVLFDDDYVIQKDSKFYVDLAGAIRNKATLLGVVNGNTESIPECTSCGVSRYYSFRRDKESPVQLVSFIHRLN